MSRAESVHPRLRGELKKLRLRAAATNGSSPLTRGTRRDEYPVLGHLRFIPAYAGNSLLGFYRRSGRTVHPRLRGELDSLRCVLFSFSRFIPAYAGNSCTETIQPGKGPVHPRLRGELYTQFKRVSRKNGSSPLTRGTHSKKLVYGRHSRFIPAYAGNSLIYNEWFRDEKVHPRLRGELFSDHN